MAAVEDTVEEAGDTAVEGEDMVVEAGAVDMEMTEAADGKEV